MCGISLIWDERSPSVARARLAQAMAEAIRHRGPDGHGLWAEPNAPLAIAHRRLAIQGLGEQGAQPMVHPGGRGVLCYNGELFGAHRVRAALVGEGVVFRGESDTEVLMHALAHWGVESTLAQVSGQFAFIWYDEVRRRLYLARDRMGIRPLYLARSGGRLAVASEQKGLLLLPWVDRTPRPEAMLRYLILGRTDDVPGETMLAGIRALPAGHWAEWDGASLTEHRYYRAGTPVPRTTVTDVREHLERAVTEQLVGDVPVGAMVSGGLDSSTVALLADRARLEGGVSSKIHLFAYHDERAEHDERAYQRAVLEAMKSPHEVHWVTSTPARLAADYERYVHHQEEPYGDISSYAEYTIAHEAARHGVKVLLNGLGGDEVFVGYPSFLGPLMLDVLHERRFAEAVEILRVTPSLGDISRFNAVFAAVYHALPARLRNTLMAARAGRFGGLPRALTRKAARDAFRDYHLHDGRGAINAALRGSIESWSIPRFLAHSDRMGLAAGVEGRVPLLDEGVIRAAWGIPAAERCGVTGLKASLRAAAASVLPVLVRDRAWKLGFHAPVNAYVGALEGPLREGHRSVELVLGGAPPWETMSPAARWLWGNLGAYLQWVKQRPLAPALDAVEATVNVASLGLA
ncbi:MAG: asparagine synthase (glutamine-hydrolyzing) [Byssovorax sp.]